MYTTMDEIKGSSMLICCVY